MKKVHFIGIAGVSMSALSKIAKSYGYQVTGSDIKLAGHNENNITKDLDLVVYTASITKGSPGFIELKKARDLSIKTITRGEFLAEIVNRYETSVVVSGMHGKTTVTTMIGKILNQAGLRPTVLPGTVVKEFAGNYLLGDSKIIVTEGCEYYDSFLNLRPKIAVITNIEEEHLDYFGTLDKIIKSFATFISNIDRDGVLIHLANDKNIQAAVKLASRLPKKIIAYGPNGDEGFIKYKFETNLFGGMNRSNCLAAFAVAKEFSIDESKIEKTLKNYHGVSRRMEFLGERNQTLVYDDYGHHPTEIKNTILALREKYPDKKQNVVFWPHQHKRIKALFKEFAKSLAIADKVFLMPIFFVPGRDQKNNFTSDDLAKEINQLKKSEIAQAFPNSDQIIKKIRYSLGENDILLTIGIPPIYEVANKFLEDK
jgi:UDP-N-acetylmuramate--alanine ligase